MKLSLSERTMCEVSVTLTTNNRYFETSVSFRRRDMDVNMWRDGRRGVEPDKGSGGSCGPVYLHGNVPTGSHARTKDEPPSARTTRARARLPVQHGRVCTYICICISMCRLRPWPTSLYASARRHVRRRGKGTEGDVLRPLLKM